ncbi:MAG: Diguanylate cyclase [Cyanobacteriota bacterium erpe_2018_sw_21hr_WHONDRS-SW48-000092_B_bin.40]|nr:Diguanylate cyclase [Cyanobacteriota bacterium erpe_2018_sw_21hr_WHONDRS-SW48-000092_B_bin.40]
MTDESGRIQLQMMLVQQSGAGALPLSILAPDSFLPFIRELEKLSLDQKLAPVIVYWSRQSAARLLPGGRYFGTLLRESTCVSCFSEERQDSPDEWCVLMESPGLSIVVYGQQAMESPNSEKYQCTGSMEPAIVRESFNRLLPIWQSLNLSESNRLEDCRVSLGPGGSSPASVQRMKAAWPVVKAPIQQGLILQGDGANASYYDNNISGEHSLQASQSTTGPNKISPIAVDVLTTSSNFTPIDANPSPMQAVVGGLSKEEMDKIIAQHLAVGLPPPDASFFQAPVNSGGMTFPSASSSNFAPTAPFGNQAISGQHAGPSGSPSRTSDGNGGVAAGSGAANSANSNSASGPSGAVSAGVNAGVNGDGSNAATQGDGPVDARVPAPAETRKGGKGGTRTNLKAVKTTDADAKNLIPPAAQTIISDIIGQLRHSSDLTSILQYAIEVLTNVLKADRGLIWKVVGDQLVVTNEYSITGHTCFVDNQLNSQESMSIVLEFLSRFPDESGAGVISIPDTAQDTDLHKTSRTLSSLLELGDVRGRLMVQLRSRGIFSGFLELQQCGNPREWTTEDAVVLQKVAEMLSVVVQQSFDQSKIEMDAQEMKLINEIASLFRDSKGQTSRDSLVKSVLLVADHMGFIHSQIYLFNQDSGVLEPQIRADKESSVELENKDNPFVAVFESGRGKVVNMEYSRKGDPFFGHDMALVLPLISEGTRLGVIGLWQRQPKRPQFKPQDRELGLTIAGHLSNVIRADMAVQQIRADQVRESLINKVSVEIKRSLKEADQIMDTLVRSVREYFQLDLCVVSLYDGPTDDATKCKFAGLDEEFPQPEPPDPEDYGHPDDEVVKPLAHMIADRIFAGALEQLRDGQTVFVTPEEIKTRLEPDILSSEWDNRSAICVPLGQGNNFKAALMLVAKDRTRSFPDKDMRMVIDLADRVGVVISHAELFATVERQAITDPMTGLFNRRYFEEQLTKEIDRFQRFGHPFSFIIVDLDYLKRINDSKGHHVGDAAIIHIGNVIKRSVREIDTVGRFGGEEFVVLLPETDLKWAKMVAERACAAMREKPVEGWGIVTASVGVATFPHDAQDKERLFELADQALFLAKHRGRNQVCTVTEDLMPSLAAGGEEELKKAMKVDNRMGPAVEKPAATAAPVANLVPEFDVELIREKGLLGMLAQLIRTVEERSSYGPDRSSRAYGYANRIAQALHLTKDHTEVVSLAAVLCNLGKIAVPEETLKRPEPLSDEDLVYINQVPHTGAKFLEPAKVLAKISPIVEAYQEHWDGSGYPNGIKGDVIPIESRIVSLVDAYTAMTSDRPYREAHSHEAALKLIQEGAGKEWDPRLVKVFVSLLQKDNKAEKH